MFQIITDVISVAARASGPRNATPVREAPQPTRRFLIWPRRG